MAKRSANQQPRPFAAHPGDRKVFSLGAGWSPNDDMTIDVAYSYLWEEDTKVNQVSAPKGSYQAKYENSAHGVGASLTYRF